MLSGNNLSLRMTDPADVAGPTAPERRNLQFSVYVSMGGDADVSGTSGSYQVKIPKKIALGRSGSSVDPFVRYEISSQRPGWASIDQTGDPDHIVITYNKRGDQGNRASLVITYLYDAWYIANGVSADYKYKIVDGGVERSVSLGKVSVATDLGMEVSSINLFN